MTRKLSDNLLNSLNMYKSIIMICITIFIQKFKQKVGKTKPEITIIDLTLYLKIEILAN